MEDEGTVAAPSIDEEAEETTLSEKKRRAKKTTVPAKKEDMVVDKEDTVAREEEADVLNLSNATYDVGECKLYLRLHIREPGSSLELFWPYLNGSPGSKTALEARVTSIFRPIFDYFS